ncbi:MAG: hypothetical protein GY720_10575 [bacterium]|nr:hypothetical protein [bacterium]
MDYPRSGDGHGTAGTQLARLVGRRDCNFGCSGVLDGTPSHFRAGLLTYSLIAATIVGIAFAVIRIQRRLGDKPAAL